MSNDASDMMRVFLCHSSSDKAKVRELYRRLLNEGIDPWLDEEKLVGGEDWELVIRKAVHSSHVVIVCLSQVASSKRGFVQKEIKFALDVADEQPEGEIFLIPLKLEQCQIPDRLSRWHCINLFEEQGYERLMKALRRSARSLGLFIGHRLYDREKIQAWDWSGVDITKGTQGFLRESDSIQFRVIQELQKGEYRIIFDDHGAGEAADIVAIRITEKSDGKKIIEVEFYHCKHAMGRPGARMVDLYEVSGQAQKSTRWMRKRDHGAELFQHLLRRESWRERGQESSRFERGSYNELKNILEMSPHCPVRFSIFIVQPGISKMSASDEQLELLSATEDRLLNTYQTPFGVIASP
jgi:hypothetical protein